MRAAVRVSYGSPDVVQLEEIEQPALENDGVLVRVRAASVNPADLYSVVGRPWVGRAQMGILRPRQRALGVDFAGTAEAVGRTSPTSGLATRCSAGEPGRSGSTSAFATPSR